MEASNLYFPRNSERLLHDLTEDQFTEDELMTFNYQDASYWYTVTMGVKDGCIYILNSDRKTIPRKSMPRRDDP